MEQIKKFLKKYHCTVLPLVHSDTIIFLCEGFWGIIVWKAHKNAACPMDKKDVSKYNDMSYARVVYPAIWDEVQKELTELLR